jgi:hypothetical protein
MGLTDYSPFPPDPHMPHGLSYHVWCTKWWQRILSIPKEMNPLTDRRGINCAQQQTDHYAWFLAGSPISINIV